MPNASKKKEVYLETIKLQFGLKSDHKHKIQFLNLMFDSGYFCRRAHPISMESIKG